MSTKTLQIPDLGGAAEVQVIEILVQPGERVEAEQPLITLEGDKATMDVPAETAGTIGKLLVQVGDTVAEGQPFAELEPAESQPEPVADTTPAHTPEEAAATAGPAAATATGDALEAADLVVIGGGPGGYTAAFRAADLGLKVTLVEKHETLGGVCLNVGCIPSKALLHTAQVIHEAQAMSAHGVRFAAPEIDLDGVRDFKNGVVRQLTGGLKQLAKQRQVRVIRGEARFADSHQLVIDTVEGTHTLAFRQCIIAAGSRVFKLPGLPWDDERVMDSTDALALKTVPEQLLIIGGGIIGLEMATVYQALGSEITVVELADQIIPGADTDLIRPLQKMLQQRGVRIHTGVKVTALKAGKKGLEAEFEGQQAPERSLYDRCLVAVGRRSNADRLNLEAAGLAADEHGFIPVDGQMRTVQAHIFAIGDIIGQPMLAHKATHEAKVAAEVAAGHKAALEARVIPSVAYTDPEVAWVGVSETQAKAEQIPYEKAVFPWAASGRALGLARPEGFTKLLFDPESRRVIGAGIIGPGAGDLISECALAIEMGAEGEDIGLTIHPHPTLGETVAMAAELFTGAITDLLPPNKRK